MHTEGKENIRDECSSVNAEIQGDDGKRKMRNKWTQEDKEGSDECSVLQKKARVVWTAELHHNFVAAINIIGLEKAVPKKILELMKGHGLSRSNIASHLQKYREYLKRPENADKSGFSFIKPSCFSNEIHTPDPFPRSRPPFLYHYPQQFPQFPEQQQNPLAPFQLGFEGNVNGLKSLCSVSPVVPSQFHNKKVSSNSFMAQARHGQSISVSNQGNMQQSLPGNALFDNQQTLGGCPTFALREPLHVDNSVASGNAMPSMVHQQPQLRPGFLPSAPVEQACNNTSPQGQNSHPSPASIRVGSIGSSGIWKQTPSLCHANTYSGPQLANPVGRIGLNQTGPYGNELLDFNPGIKWMDEICNGKRPMEADGISNRVLMFNGLSPSLTTQGESSSRAFVSPNQFQAMPPPEQQQLEEANEISNHVLMFNGLSPSYTTQGESSSRAFVSPNQFQAMPPPEQEQLEEKEFDDLLDSFRSSSPGRLHLSNSVSGIAVNQAGPISSELLKVNPDVNHWRVFFQSPSYTTQGKLSSRAFVSPNQIQAMPPLEQQWLEEEEFDVLLDSFRSSSPGRSQLSNSASRIAVNQTGPIGSELLEVISDKNPMDEVHYGKRPLEADGISNRILKFNDSSTSCATQGESSSGAFVSTNQFQEMGPPEQHKQLKEEECNGLLDFYRSSNPEEQSMYQQEWGGGLVDPQFDICEFLLNSP